jgi:nucleoside permease NupC
MKLCRLLTPFVFTLITTILVLHIVWVVNEKQKDVTLIGLACGTYLAYLLTIVLLSYGQQIPAGVALLLNIGLLIAFPVVGDKFKFKKADGSISWEAGWAFGLGCMACIIFGILAYQGKENCLYTQCDT